MIRISSCLAIALLLVTACETERCPDGMAFPPGGGDCAPLGDAGLDAGLDAATSDAGEDAGDDLDAGPCGMVCPASAPNCDPSNGICEQCLVSTHCITPTPFCEANECVACTMDADCTLAAAARCAAGVCVACDASPQCAGVIGADICEAAVCVECTATSVSACSGSCRSDNTCSSFADDRITCQTCDTDANCVGPDHYCVPNGTGVGHCLQEFMGAGSCARPFGARTPVRTTLSDVEGMDFCGIDEAVTTCEAVRALLEDVSCDMSPCPAGGICRTVGTFLEKCTYACGANSDCPPSGPTSFCRAPPGETDTYCGAPEP